MRAMRHHNERACYEALGITRESRPTPPATMEACPCDGCPNTSRCAAERVACSQFYFFFLARPKANGAPCHGITRRASVSAPRLAGRKARARKRALRIRRRVRKVHAL